MPTNSDPGAVNVRVPEESQSSYNLRNTTSYEGMRQNTLPNQEGIDNMPENATPQTPNVPNGYTTYVGTTENIDARKVTEKDGEQVHTPTGAVHANKGDYVIRRQSNYGPYDEVLSGEVFEQTYKPGKNVPK